MKQQRRKKKRRKGGKRSKKVDRADEQQVELLPQLPSEAGDESSSTEVASDESPSVDASADESPADEVALDESPPTPGPRKTLFEYAPPEPPEETKPAEVAPRREPRASEPDVSEPPAVEPQVADAHTDDAPRPAGKQLARARDFVESGRIEEAIALYREVVRENPASLKAHNNLGVLFDELGRHKEAVEHFTQALEIEPENIEVLTNYGVALTALARFDEADAALRRALRVSPDEPGARLAAGMLSFRRGLYVQAEAELRWVCDRERNNGLAFYYRGEALNRVGHFEEASSLLERATELLPNDPRPLLTLGHLYDRRTMRAEAAEMFRRARELHG